MKILKLEVSVLKENELPEVTYGTKEIIIEKLKHLWKNAKNKKDKEVSIINYLNNGKFDYEEESNNNIINIGFCIIFSDDNVLSINIEEIVIKEQKVPAAFTDFSQHSLISVFPEDYIELRKILEDKIEHLENSDNYRICKKGDEEGEKLYQESLNNGCCGGFDEEFVIGDKTYKVGCNYGH